MVRLGLSIDKGFATKCVIAFATMPKGVMFSNIFELQPGNGEPLSSIIPFDTVADIAFTPL